MNNIHLLFRALSIVYETFEDFYNEYLKNVYQDLDPGELNKYKCSFNSKYLIVKPESFKNG